MDDIYLRAKNMNCIGIDDYDGNMAVSLEDDDTKRQVKAAKDGPER